MKYRYFVTSIQNSLPTNKKTFELLEWARGFLHLLIEEELVKAFVREFNEKVAQLNEKYPRTNKLVVEWSPTRAGMVSPHTFITARDMKNYDNSMCLAMYSIKGEYNYAEDNVQ